MAIEIFAGIGVAFGALGIAIATAAARKASIRLATSAISKRVRELSVDVTSMQDEFDKLTKLVSRRNARENMAKARDAKNGKSETKMTDEEWREYATQELQQGRPIKFDV